MSHSMGMKWHEVGCVGERRELLGVCERWMRRRLLLLLLLMLLLLMVLRDGWRVRVRRPVGREERRREAVGRGNPCACRP